MQDIFLFHPSPVYQKLASEQVASFLNQHSKACSIHSLREDFCPNLHSHQMEESVDLLISQNDINFYSEPAEFIYGVTEVRNQIIGFTPNHQKLTPRSWNPMAACSAVQSAPTRWPSSETLSTWPSRSDWADFPKSSPNSSKPTSWATCLAAWTSKWPPSSSTTPSKPEALSTK